MIGKRISGLAPVRYKAGTLAGALAPFLALLMVVSIPAPARAFPQMPHQFYGDVTINGAPAGAGIMVSARIGGVEYASVPTDAKGRYGYVPSLMMPADDIDTTAREGGKPGDTVQVCVAGVPGGTAHFSYGQVTNLDLDVSLITPSVNTAAATLVSTSGATLNGSLTSLGTAPLANVYFEYGKTTDYGSYTRIRALAATGPFSFPISGLAQATRYHFRVIAEAGAHGTYAGVAMTFVTSSISGSSSSEVSTSAPAPTPAPPSTPTPEPTPASEPASQVEPAPNPTPAPPTPAVAPKVGPKSGTATVGFATRSLTITPAQAYRGETVDISLVVTNNGDLGGRYEVVLKLDSTAIDSQEVTLDAGDSRMVSFRVTADGGGNHRVSIGSLSGTFMVKEREPAPSPVPTPTPSAPPGPTPLQPPLATTLPTPALPLPTAASVPPVVPAQTPASALFRGLMMGGGAAAVVAGLAGFIVMRRRYHARGTNRRAIDSLRAEADSLRKDLNSQWKQVLAGKANTPGVSQNHLVSKCYFLTEMTSLIGTYSKWMQRGAVPLDEEEVERYRSLIHLVRKMMP